MRFVKERRAAPPGSIPALLGMFGNEVRFHRELAPHLTVRVPACHAAREHQGATRLELEDLSSWREGGDPVAVARVLARLHRQWEDDDVLGRWPWLDRTTPEAAAAIGELYDATWPLVRDRHPLPHDLVAAGSSLVGGVAALELDEARCGWTTIVHGDAALRNVRTSPGGEVALVDWEDVRIADGAVDLVWLLVTSVDPTRWRDVVAGYREVRPVADAAIAAAVPAAVAQALLSLADVEPASPDAVAAVGRLAALVGRRPSTG